MADQLIQLPPQNLEAEEYVLGAMMLSSAAINSVAAEGLRADHFYRPSHGSLYRLMCEMHDRGDAVDAVTVRDSVECGGAMLKEITAEHLRELATLVPAASNAPHHARIIKELAAVRSLIEAGEKIAALGRNRDGSTERLIEQSEEALRRAVDQSVTTRAATPMSEGLEEIAAELKEAKETGIVRTGLKTGFKGLDNGTMRGLWPGQLVCLAARPGFGKSTLAQNIAEYVVDEGGSTLFVSLEMSRRELQTRSLARASRVDSELIQGCILTDDDLAKVREGYKVVQKRTKLHVQDDGNITPALIGAEARRLKRTVGLDLIVVDYVQLLVQGVKENKADEVGGISRSLKLLARDLDVPVLMVAQLNRGVENRQEKRPGLADLRDSGALEQDSDVVMFIYSDAAYNKDVAVEDAGTYELIVEKNRRGSKGTEKLLFIGKYLTFKETA